MIMLQLSNLVCTLLTKSKWSSTWPDKNNFLP